MCPGNLGKWKDLPEQAAALSLGRWGGQEEKGVEEKATQETGPSICGQANLRSPSFAFSGIGPSQPLLWPCQESDPCLEVPVFLQLPEEQLSEMPKRRGRAFLKEAQHGQRS